ncbi:U-Kazal-Dg21.2-like [Amyelois transitella]|uniref:U-Kazal-Dg21.2-like n=1 Tax=Amyelois transitella TaxID=680683 RepID=UPI00298F4ECD|nr:U-Kazal-Dg21.2-like [Amyelois transitella]
MDIEGYSEQLVWSSSLDPTSKIHVICPQGYLPAGHSNKLTADLVAQSYKESCNAKCAITANDETRCGFEAKLKKYIVFPSQCALVAYADCYNAELIETDLEFCLKDTIKASRRMYGESCPMFCPNHWRPVCGASKIRDYKYRTFNNACYLDMLNCRSEEELNGYVEVPLEFCPRHSMKNMFKEQIVVTNLHDYRNYNLRK